MANAKVPETASVVVPTYDALPLLRYTLQSLKHQDAPAAAYEVVVVDDASRDGTSDWLSTYAAPYRLTALHNACGLGRSATRNRGLDAASGDIVIFLDADMICPPTLVSAHLRLHAEGAAETAPTCVSGYPWFWRSVDTWSFAQPQGPLLDPALLSNWEAFERWAGGPLGEPGTPVAVARPEAAPFLWCITRVLSVQRAVAVDVGGFEERFRGYGLEDWEFGYRLERRGVRIVAHPTAAAFHQSHPPSARDKAASRRNYGIFLELHPDFKVALLGVCPATADGRYERLCVAYHHLRKVAPTLAAALNEVVVDHAWTRHKEQANPLRDLTFWANRWGPQRTARITWEHVAAMSDGGAREAVALFQQLTGTRGR